MDDYFELAQKCQALQAEYEQKAALLDPLRWRLLEARNAADTAWARMRDKALDKMDARY